MKNLYESIFSKPDEISQAANDALFDGIERILDLELSTSAGSYSGVWEPKPDSVISQYKCASEYSAPKLYMYTISLPVESRILNVFLTDGNALAIEKIRGYEISYPYKINNKSSVKSKIKDIIARFKKNPAMFDKSRGMDKITFNKFQKLFPL